MVCIAAAAGIAGERKRLLSWCLCRGGAVRRLCVCVCVCEEAAPAVVSVCAVVVLYVVTSRVCEGVSERDGGGGG